MSALYSQTSPYRYTTSTNGYLGVLNLIDLPASAEDAQFSILTKYANRPDLLAYDLYGDSRLWWVFAVRNKSVIKDSIYDFVPGTIIYIPSIQSIKAAIGS